MSTSALGVVPFPEGPSAVFPDCFPLESMILKSTAHIRAPVSSELESLQSDSMRLGFAVQILTAAALVCCFEGAGAQGQSGEVVSILLVQLH